MSWRALRYFNLYRLVLSGTCVVLIWMGTLPATLGIFDRPLFFIVANIYFAGAIGLQFAVHHRLPRYTVQVFVHVLLDIIAITLMMHASGGVSSGLGMLLVVVIAGGSLVTAGRTAILFAAIATLAVLAEEVYAFAFDFFPFANYTHAGFLGATFFATAFLGHVLATRAHESETLAAQRGVDLENLARLNEHIVQRMQSGIVVLDYKRRVRRINDSARRLLGLNGSLEGERIEGVSPDLAAQMDSWLALHGTPLRLMRPVHGEVDVQVSFTRLGSDARAGVLVFLEDASRMRQRAQQLKLASLGRLTASIAHEIRNPLGAISHAGQLLSESRSLAPEDDRLLRIIIEQSARMNDIIEDIMHIKPRASTTPKSIKVQPWLEAFVDEFTSRQQIPRAAIMIAGDSEDMEVTMDASQLHQVLWNLCENGLRYSKGIPLLEINYGLRRETERPHLDVIDHGTGIPEEFAEQLFEPFFTTEPQGTGLGLYIARELCESNQASLSLYANTKEGCCFRISFAHPGRQHLSIQ
ncbi:MAG: ATP-binding protein [Gammaproteobacteria bacterium]|nr:ATP-binding protein [Gammaproteobacteria bacterium]